MNKFFIIVRHILSFTNKLYISWFKLASKVLLITVLLLKTSVQAATLDYIIATVNEEAITNLMYEIAIAEQKQFLTSSRINIPPENELRALVAKQLYDSALLDSEVRIISLQLSGSDIDAEIEKFKQQRSFDNKTFNDYLSNLGYTLSDFKKSIGEKINRQRLIDNFVKSKISVSTSEIQDFYQKKYGSSNLVYSGQNFMIGLTSEPSAQEVADAQQIMLDYYEKIVNQTITIDNLKEIFENTVDYQYQKFTINEVDLVEIFKQELDKLSIGEVSRPFVSNFGVHIMELSDKQAQTAVDFDDVSEELSQQYFQEEFGRVYEDYISSLANKAKIVFFSNSFKDDLDYYFANIKDSAF